MGNLCSSCFRGTAIADYPTPDMETRRRQQAEAAQKRLEAQQNRGIKNPENVKRMQRKTEELEEAEMHARAGQSGPPLRWQVG